MHLKSYPYSIATIVTDKAIEVMLESETEGDYKDDHPWLVAEEIFDKACSIDRVIPILFASRKPGIESKFSHWSTIKAVSVTELHRGKWETRVRFDRLEQFNLIWGDIDSVMLKTSQEQMDREQKENIRTYRTSLSENHIHPYAICETPAFIDEYLQREQDKDEPDSLNS